MGEIGVDVRIGYMIAGGCRCRERRLSGRERLHVIVWE